MAGGNWKEMSSDWVKVAVPAVYIMLNESRVSIAEKTHQKIVPLIDAFSSVDKSQQNILWQDLLKIPKIFLESNELFGKTMSKLIPYYQFITHVSNRQWLQKQQKICQDLCHTSSKSLLDEYKASIL